MTPAAAADQLNRKRIKTSTVAESVNISSSFRVQWTHLLKQPQINGYETLTVLIFKYECHKMFLWVLAPCSLVDSFQSFGETHCLHIQGWRWKQYVSSGPKMETVCFSETLASTDEYTRRQNPEEQRNNPHCCGNLKSHMKVTSPYLCFNKTKGVKFAKHPYAHLTTCFLTSTVRTDTSKKCLRFRSDVILVPLDRVKFRK
jgi:hypothetical protein